MDTFLVSATWEFEGALPLVAFQDLNAAVAFIAACTAHQAEEPDDDEETHAEWVEWHEAHPGKPYLSHEDHLGGVHSFGYTELTVL